MTHSRFILKQSAYQFYFSLKLAGKSELILSSERYTRKASALEGIAAVRVCAVYSSQFRRRRSQHGESYFVLRAANGEVIATSKMYSSASAREADIDAVQRLAPDASVEDHTVLNAITHSTTLH